MVDFAPPAATFYLTEWTPFWLSMDPRYKEIVAGLLGIPKLLGTTHESLIELGDLLNRAGRLTSHPVSRPTGTAFIAVDDGEAVRCADPWLEGIKGLACVVVTEVLNKNPPEAVDLQIMRSRIADLDMRGSRIVPTLFIGLRQGNRAAVFGAAEGGSFALKETGFFKALPGGGLVMDRSHPEYRAGFMYWSDTELMQHVESFTNAGFELVGSPMTIICPPIPQEWDDRVRWAERFIDDGLGMYVVR